jgi:signal transduction histidine kinase
VTLRAAEAALFRHVARGERARIARELHDVVAHHLSMIAVQADLARLATEGMPSDGVRQLEAIGDTARDALREMHRLLGVLRDPETASVDRAPQPGLANINDLIDRARDVGGASVRLIVSGPVSDLDPGVDLTAYRIVQEALSNARRHAPGASVDVVLRYNSDQLRLQIRDSGAGAGRTVPAAGGGAPAPAADGDRLTAGNGLLGMRERAAMVGGTMRAVEAPVAGFVIEAVLPIRSAPAVALQEEVAGSVGR